MIQRWLCDGVAVIALLGALQGCRGNDSAETKTRQPPVAKDAAPTVSPITIIPSAPDFEAKVMAEIDETNYERELARLERALR